jgi:hypothetical protein
MNEPPCWKQHYILHCPKKDCKGMLMQNDYEMYDMCSHCGSKFMVGNNIQEVDEQ